MRGMAEKKVLHATPTFLPWVNTWAKREKAPQDQVWPWGSGEVMRWTLTVLTGLGNTPWKTVHQALGTWIWASEGKSSLGTQTWETGGVWAHGTARLHPWREHWVRRTASPDWKCQHTELRSRWHPTAHGANSELTLLPVRMQMRNKWREFRSNRWCWNRTSL